jgi:hypothetical protein
MACALLRRPGWTLLFRSLLLLFLGDLKFPSGIVNEGAGNMACREDVLRLYHRGLSPPDIAERLNCMREYVRATLRRAGLSATQAEHRANQIR